jgi:hypothetical protein
VIRADSSFQGDLFDPATGQRLVVRIPPWYGAAALVSSTEIIAPVATPLDVAPAPTGVWTDIGYLAPGSF